MYEMPIFFFNPPSRIDHNAGRAPFGTLLEMTACQEARGFPGTLASLGVGTDCMVQHTLYIATRTEFKPRKEKDNLLRPPLTDMRGHARLITARH